MWMPRRIWNLARGVRPWIAVAVAMRLAVAATYISQALLMASILARLLQGAGIREQAARLAAVAALILARLALLWAGEIVAQTTSAKTKERLRTALFEKLGELGPRFTGGNRTGEVMATLVDGVEALESYFGAYLPALVTAILMPTVAVAILAGRDAELAAVVTFCVLAAVVIPPILNRALAAASRKRRAAFNAMGSEFLDTLQGMVTLKAFGATANRRASLAARADELAHRMSSEMSLVLLRNGIFAAVVIGGLAVTTAIAAVRAAHGDLALGTLFVALFLAREALRPVAELSAAFHASYAARVAAEQIERLLAATLPIPERAGNVTIPNLRPSIEYRDVTFAYDPADGPVLQNFSMRVDPGERVAVVGPSGAGKTTLVALLLRFVEPQHGSILLGGHDLRDLPIEQLRSLIAVVSQETYLFGGSVRDNLALARPDASDREIENAARIANAHGFITGFPDGYATIVGERGLRLSGGQRQRLAIARAVLKDAPILILDEATANVDAAAEAAIAAALDRIAADRTTIVIAHRLSTVRHADRIVVLEAGRVVETGDHDALVERHGAYARLVSAQAV
jgi:ABC-type multidrug transport system fused ATPase/permease subunit